MVVYDNNIKGKLGFLVQSTVYSIKNGLFAIVYGYNNRCFNLEILFVEVWVSVIVGVDTRSDFLQMDGGCMLHFYLHLTIGWVDIVELLNTTGTSVCLYFGI